MSIDTDITEDNTIVEALNIACVKLKRARSPRTKREFIQAYQILDSIRVSDLAIETAISRKSREHDPESLKDCNGLIHQGVSCITRHLPELKSLSEKYEELKGPLRRYATRLQHLALESKEETIVNLYLDYRKGLGGQEE